MSKKIEKKGSPRRRGSSLPRLRERVRAALVFAIPAHAPEPVVDALAIAIGMLEAVADLDGGSFQELVVARAKRALALYREWRRRSGGRGGAGGDRMSAGGSIRRGCAPPSDDEGGRCWLCATRRMRAALIVATA